MTSNFRELSMLLLTSLFTKHSSAGMLGSTIGFCTVTGISRKWDVAGWFLQPTLHWISVGLLLFLPPWALLFLSTLAAAAQERRDVEVVPSEPALLLELGEHRLVPERWSLFLSGVGY